MTEAEFSAWCREFKGVSVYTIGVKLSCQLNSQTFSFAIMITVFLIVAIELITHKIDHVCQNILFIIF